VKSFVSASSILASRCFPILATSFCSCRWAGAGVMPQGLFGAGWPVVSEYGLAGARMRALLIPRCRSRGRNGAYLKFARPDPDSTSTARPVSRN